jgi:hypothetical protein
MGQLGLGRDDRHGGPTETAPAVFGGVGASRRPGYPETDSLDITGEYRRRYHAGLTPTELRELRASTFLTSSDRLKGFS